MPLSAVPVVGLREGTWPRREDDRLTLGGIAAGTLLFRRGGGLRPEPPGGTAGISDKLVAQAAAPMMRSHGDHPR